MRRALALLLVILAACSDDEDDGVLPAGGLELEVVAEGYPAATDLQFVPGEDELLLIAQKGGRLSWHSLADGSGGRLLEIEASSNKEMGLLGVAFHPSFPADRRIFVNYTAAKGSAWETRISELILPPGDPFGPAVNERVLLRYDQPTEIHNGGQLQFGPDGMLYIASGDGGGGEDPDGNGQRTDTLLGKILRIDVDARNHGFEYAIPPDNPFVGDGAYRQEIFALGFRNPWRMSFDPRGRLVVADVGQERWEEIDLVAAGDNLGWKIREGRQCFEPPSGCDSEGLVEPIFEYDREAGQSVTGGYVYLGERVPALRGRYLFTDFISGRFWALELPAAPQSVEAEELGRTGRSVATLGRDASGEIYVADFESGEILRLQGLR